MKYIATGKIGRPVKNGTIANNDPGYNYISLINNVLERNPGYTVDPTSLLYKLAVQQYNSIVIGTTTRPPIPSWFCGFIEPTTGLLRTEEEENVLVIKPVYATYKTPTREIQTSTQLGVYQLDRCLAGGYGCPGGEIWRGCITDTNGTIISTGIDYQNGFIPKGFVLGSTLDSCENVYCGSDADMLIMQKTLPLNFVNCILEKIYGSTLRLTAAHIVMDSISGVCDLRKCNCNPGIYKNSYKWHANVGSFAIRATRLRCEDVYVGGGVTINGRLFGGWDCPCGWNCTGNEAPVRQ